MNKWLKNNRFSFYLLSFSALLILFVKAVSYFPLSQAGPTSLYYFNSIKERGLGIALFLFITSVIWWKLTKNGFIGKFISWYTGLTSGLKSYIVLVTSLSFTFILYFPNIIHGYFNYDDFELINLSSSAPLWNLLFTPYGDHPIPLFQIELLFIKFLFGVNPIPYNLFVWVTASLIPFFTFLTLRKLGIKERVYWIFFLLFSGSMMWGEFLTGYFAVSVYLQNILFYAISSWAYLSWKSSSKKIYLLIWFTALLSAVLVDISGIWAIPAMLVFMLSLWRMKNDGFPKIEAYIFTLVSAIVAIYLLYVYWYAKTGVFVSTSLHLGKIISDSYAVFSTGIASTLIAPNVSFLFLQPSFYKYFINIWPVFLAVISVLSVWILLYGYYRSGREQKIIITYLAFAFVMTAGLIVLARPTSVGVAIFPFKHTVMPYFWYCLLFAISIETWFSKNDGKKEINLRREIFVIFIIMFFTVQQLFGFFNTAFAVQAKERRLAVAELSETVGSSIYSLAQKGPITIPNIDGAYINPLLSGYSLVQYLDFIPWNENISLIRNESMAKTGKKEVVTVKSLRESVSPIFKKSLVDDSGLKSIYLKPIQLSVSYGNNLPAEKILSQIGRGYGDGYTVTEREFNPEEKHLLKIILNNESNGNRADLELYADTDFGKNLHLGTVHIDQFTKYMVSGNEYWYTLLVDLNQIYGIALSGKVSNLRLKPSKESGNSRVKAVLY